MKEENNERDSGVVDSTQSTGPISTGAMGRGTIQWIREELAQLVADARTVQTAQKALIRAQQLAADYRDDWTVRFMILRLKETAGHTEHALEQWSGLLAEHPDDIDIVRYCGSHLVREHREAEALALIDQYMPLVLDDYRAGLARAELLSEIRAYALSDALFHELIELHDRRELRIAFAKRLTKRGLLADAVKVLAPIAAKLTPKTKAQQLAESITSDYAFFRRFESEEGLAERDIRIIAMKHAILSFRHRVLPDFNASSTPAIALLTGNLGPGGAERQLTRLACNLQKMATESEAEGHDDRGKAAMRPKTVEVLVKQYTDQGGSSKNHRLDFFADSLLEAGVPITEINLLPAISVSHQPVDDADLRRLLESLPAPVHYGVTRLAPRLRERCFDVVSLWQDGTCLFGALAALLAGVPVIHLVFRGLPPNIRKERSRPEYEVLYRALAQIPGVQFVSNSRAAAEEYARWLDLPLTRFQILYNGVPEPETVAPASEQARWNAFVEATPDATETIGGVFRFEPDKRPLLWIKFAARYLKRRPHARFLIVGDGRLQEKAVELGAELGLGARLMFVGLSLHVGFWYSKLNANVLLSRYEGLPNVLIEAQLLGIATLSTPAGGASECFVDGVTGHLLECADQPDLSLACDRLAALIDVFQADSAIGEHARNRARMLFSVEAMLERFSGLCLPVEIASEAHHIDLPESRLVPDRHLEISENLYPLVREE